MIHRYSVVFILLTSCLSFREVHCNDEDQGGDDGCDSRKGEECLSRLMSFSIEGYFPFQNEVDFDKRCMEALEAELCLREYSEVCLKGISKMIVTMFVHNANMTLGYLCRYKKDEQEEQEKKGNDDFDDYISCIHNLIPRLEVCRMETKKAMEIVQLQDGHKLPFFCCAEFPTGTCFSQALEETCRMSTMQFYAMMNDKLDHDFAHFPCPRNTEDTERSCRELGLPFSYHEITRTSPLHFGIFSDKNLFGGVDLFQYSGNSANAKPKEIERLGLDDQYGINTKLRY